MGITGLLPFLKKSSKKTNIREFSGGTVAIDSYCWLHKGVFSCAEKLMMGETTNAYVSYCMKYINMLLKYNIKPILVFDGQQLPAKKQTEIKRRTSRQINRRKAIELIQMGQVAKGTNLLKRALDITHEIALELIKHCQDENIDCIIAPYEADAQLAYLNINSIADVVITEDSDLILFGCKKIFFKMDFNGNGILIEQDQLHLAMDMRPEQFNMDKFRHICILSGCDYLPSLPGIGLTKARQFITRNTDQNIHKALTRIGLVLNMKSLVVTKEYRDAFILADITFKHQLVFCPLQRKQVRLNSPPADITENQLQYAGKELDEELALQLALGNCDPSTLRMVHNFNPDKIGRKRKRDAETIQTVTIHTSIWSNNYELKTKNHVSSSGNAVNLSIGNEQAIQRNSLKDVSSNLYSDPTMQYNRFSECQDLNKNAILDMYNSRIQDAKLTISPEKNSEEYSYLAKNSTSPELFRQKNPFVKRVSDFTTSPSVLFNGNCRKRGRNILRIRQTIVDENTIIESRYFSKQNNEKCDVLKMENKKIKDVNLKSTKCNVIPKMYTYIHDTETSQEQLKISSTTDHADDTSSMKDIDNMLSSNRNEYLTNSYENILKNSCPYNRITEASSMGHCTMIDEKPVPDNFLVSSNSSMEASNNLINYGNASSSQDDLLKWSNVESCPASSHKKKIFKKQSSANLLLQINSVTKRKQLHQNKQVLPISGQQSLLNMYGFQRRGHFADNLDLDICCQG